MSILEKSPKHLIKEIILIDDNNEDPTIGSDLSQIEKVIVIRNEKREGLIRGRIKGIKAASGEVVMILDSHCEVCMLSDQEILNLEQNIYSRLNKVGWSPCLFGSWIIQSAWWFQLLTSLTNMISPW